MENRPPTHSSILDFLDEEENTPAKPGKALVPQREGESLLRQHLALKEKTVHTERPADPQESLLRRHVATGQRDKNVATNAQPPVDNNGRWRRQPEQTDKVTVTSFDWSSFNTDTDVKEPDTDRGIHAIDSDLPPWLRGTEVDFDEDSIEIDLGVNLNEDDIDETEIDNDQSEVPLSGKKKVIRALQNGFSRLTRALERKEKKENTPGLKKRFLANMARRLAKMADIELEAEGTPRSEQIERIKPLERQSIERQVAESQALVRESLTVVNREISFLHQLIEISELAADSLNANGMMLGNEANKARERVMSIVSHLRYAGNTVGAEIRADIEKIQKPTDIPSDLVRRISQVLEERKFPRANNFRATLGLQGFMDADDLQILIEDLDVSFMTYVQRAEAAADYGYKSKQRKAKADEFRQQLTPLEKKRQEYQQKLGMFVPAARPPVSRPGVSSTPTITRIQMPPRLGFSE